MLKKLLISIIILYFLVLIQSSFLVYFLFWGRVLNLILILIIFWNLLENPKKYFGLYLAFIGGFFLDIFSNHFIGFNILILLGLAFFIKLIFRRYVEIPLFKKS